MNKRTQSRSRLYYEFWKYFLRGMSAYFQTSICYSDLKTKRLEDVIESDFSIVVKDFSSTYNKMVDKK
jgi:hypothetical protein